MVFGFVTEADRFAEVGIGPFAFEPGCVFAFGRAAAVKCVFVDGDVVVVAVVEVVVAVVAAIAVVAAVATAAAVAAVAAAAAVVEVVVSDLVG